MVVGVRERAGSRRGDSDVVELLEGRGWISGL